MTYQSHTPAAKVQLEKIGQIAITVTHIAHAKAFYGETLGMRFLFETGNLCFFQCGDIRLMLSASAGSEPRGGTILYFQVEDLPAVHAELARQSVEFMQTPHLVAKMPDHDLWMAFLKDPDGNILGLMSEVRG